MPASPREVLIWDAFVRLFHWSVATLFLLDFWVLEAGDPPHEWVGYAIGFLLLGRVLWGFIGSHNARFSSFPDSGAYPPALARHAQPFP